MQIKVILELKLAKSLYFDRIESYFMSLVVKKSEYYLDNIKQKLSLWQGTRKDYDAKDDCQSGGRAYAALYVPTVHNVGFRDFPFHFLREESFPAS